MIFYVYLLCFQVHLFCSLNQHFVPFMAVWHPIAWKHILFYPYIGWWILFLVPRGLNCASLNILTPILLWANVLHSLGCVCFLGQLTKVKKCWVTLYFHQQSRFLVFSNWLSPFFIVLQPSWRTEDHTLPWVSFIFT